MMKAPAVAARVAMVAAAGLVLLLLLHETLRAFGISRLQTAMNLGAATALAAVLYGMHRVKAPIWLYLPVPLVALLPQLNPDWATYWHGLMHSSITLALYNQGWHPENPLMAGTLLMYPYGHHLLLAALMKVLPLSAAQMMVLSDGVALLLFVWLMDCVARQFSTASGFRILVAVIAICGPSPLVQTPLLEMVGQLDVFHRAEWRYFPLDKFLGANNNQVGLVFCALALWKVLQLVAADTDRFVGVLVVLFFAVLGAALVYPASWLGIIAALGAVGLFRLFTVPAGRRGACALIAIGFIASLLALPFLLAITRGKSGDSLLRLDLSFTHLGRNFADVVLLLAPLLLLFWFARVALLARIRQQRVAFVTLGVVVVSSLVLYLFVSMPDHSEYKFLHLAVLALAIPAAAALESLWPDKPFWLAGSVVLLLLPLGAPAMQLLRPPPVSDRLFSEGGQQKHSDPSQQAVYEWILSHTAPDAVFIDSTLTIPALTGRSLLVGTDIRRDSGGLKGREGTVHDGWLVSADEFLRQNTGVDEERRRSLEAAVVSLLTQRGSVSTDDAIDVISASIRGRDLYMVVRAEQARRQLGSHARLTPVFTGDAATIYRVAGK